MKKHKTFEHNLVGERCCDEFNGAKDLRELSYVSLLYIEYYLNEILLLKFKHPEKIIDENELGSFKNKLLILEAFGVFDSHSLLLKNIKLIQRIRNYYAHNLLEEEKAPSCVADRIRQLVYFDWDGNVTDYDYPWDEHIDPLDAQLHVCALEMTNQLIFMRNRIIEETEQVSSHNSGSCAS